jgi:hypothetical protein
MITKRAENKIVNKGMEKSLLLMFQDSSWKSLELFKKLNPHSDI